jgi:NADPH:quinone reductase-like Zn-dependent oxidoreductase
MKAIEVREFGVDKIAIVERERPEPGPGQVLVRIRALSLNYRDLMVIKGQYNPRMRLPAIPFSDGAGEVAEVGTGVGRFKPGDRVCGTFMPAWVSGEVDEVTARSALGAGVDGVGAEYVVFGESALVTIPGHLSFDEAATLPCAGVTAWNALVTTGHLRPEETVLLQGTGGVSMFALQFGQLMKARVIAMSSSDAKLARVREMGVADMINYRAIPEWDKRVREMTNGRGVDHVIEVGGTETLPKSLKAVRMGGTISLIGVLSGAGELNFVPIFMRTIRLQGIFVGSREMFEDMNRAIATHELRPVVDRVFPVDEIKEALRYMESGAHFGKICLSFDSPIS